MPIKKTRKSQNKAERNSGRRPNKSIEVFVKRDFLTQKELRGLTKYVLTHEADFTPSTVIPDGVPEGSTDPSYRKSRVLYDLGEYGSLIQDRIREIIPEVLKVFRREPFPINHIDTQITASNHGDFFKVHQDNSVVEPLDVYLRELSYVHYFNSEPKAFSGGQLRIYDSENGEARNSETRSARTILPRQNTLVFFPSSYDHEVLPVRCATGKFANSRFTVNGWIIREATPANEADSDYTESNEENAVDTENNGETPVDAGWLTEAVRALSVPRSLPFLKLFLTLEEAAEYSGLSQQYLEWLVQEEKIAAVDDGCWKIRRADLESL